MQFPDAVNKTGVQLTSGNKFSVTHPIHPFILTLNRKCCCTTCTILLLDSMMSTTERLCSMLCYCCPPPEELVTTIQLTHPPHGAVTEYAEIQEDPVEEFLANQIGYLAVTREV